MALVDQLVQCTSNGPVTQWGDRIGEIARKTGVPLERINWYQSPLNIAHEVYSLCVRYSGSETKLKRAVNEAIHGD